MAIPNIRTMSDARYNLATIVTGITTQGWGPQLVGRRGRPDAVITSFALFDQLRDLAVEWQVLRALPMVLDRIRQPAGASVATLDFVIQRPQTPAAQTQIRYYPELWSDLRQVPPRLDVDNLLAALLALHGGGLDGYPLPVARHEDAAGLRYTLVPAEDEQHRPFVLIWHRTGDTPVPVLAQEGDQVLREALSTTGDEVGADVRQKG